MKKNIFISLLFYIGIFCFSQNITTAAGFFPTVSDKYAQFSDYVVDINITSGVSTQPGDTCYGWHAGGMLATVRTPEGKTVTFGYDALGRRVSKSVGNGTRRFGWDGNVVLHEWDVNEAGKPKIVADATGREEYNGTEKPENLVTWVYDGTSFTPVAKVADGERYTIVQDYLGTPTQAYDSRGELVWEMLLDMYGKVTECYGDRTLVPFRYQGQYEDEETGLYYNRYRYYDPNTGTYISQDPIGLQGGMQLYAYVHDSNSWIDPLGLRKYIVYQAYELDAKGNRTGKIYTGRTSGDDNMSVDQILNRRHTNHHRNLERLSCL